MNAARTAEVVQRAVDEVTVCDIHTHLFDPGMGGLLLSGIDELLTYHYHVAELFRVRPDLDAAEFAASDRTARAELVWRELFIERSPVSEVGVGIVALLDAFGIDPRERDLAVVRRAFGDLPIGEQVDRVLREAGVGSVVMTNDPLDPVERAVWERGFDRDPRFAAALRLDSAIVDWPRPASALRALGYEVGEQLDAASLDEARRYLVEWAGRMEAAYMAVSLPPGIRYPDAHDPTVRLLSRAVLPAARETGLPVALMIGVVRGVNPRLQLAGDGVGKADVSSLARLAHDHPDVKFLVTYLSRENQHELCVTARKFANVVPFGCWWFVNNPALIREITAMRLDMLGLSFVPQHSDARVLEQLVFKWRRSRAIVGDVLATRWAELVDAGASFDGEAISADVARLFDGSLIRPR